MVYPYLILEDVYFFSYHHIGWYFWIYPLGSVVYPLGSIIIIRLVFISILLLSSSLLLCFRRVYLRDYGYCLK